MGNKYNDSEVIIRRAKKEDMVAVAEMIQELADFEKMPNGPQLSVKVRNNVIEKQTLNLCNETDLQRDGFESQPAAFNCLVAEFTKDKSIVGYALYFPTYSTWQGRSMMLEDLYVRTSERRHGIGHKLFNAVAKEAKLSGSSRLDFHVLEWNNARSFYEGKGALNLTKSEEWCYYRLTGEALEVAADEAGDLK